MRGAISSRRVKWDLSPATDGREQAGGRGEYNRDGGRLGDGGRCRARRGKGLAKVAQQDGQVVHIDHSVAVEIALRPAHPRLTEIGEHDRQIVDVHAAVAVGIAGQAISGRGDARPIGAQLHVVAAAVFPNLTRRAGQAGRIFPGQIAELDRSRAGVIKAE